MSPAIPVPDGLRSSAVALRPLRVQDAAAYAAAFRADPRLGRLIGLVADPDLEAARAAARATEADAESGTRLALAVARAEDDAFVGMVALNRFAWRHRRCDLGFWLDIAERCHGIGTAAARLVLDWAFPALDLLKVEIATTADNLAGQALAARLGFTREARPDPAQHRGRPPRGRHPVWPAP